MQYEPGRRCAGYAPALPFHAGPGRAASAGRRQHPRHVLAPARPRLVQHGV